MCYNFYENKIKCNGGKPVEKHKNFNLVCPIRGVLDATYFSKDGLKITEEARRIECIKFLLSRKYPKDNFQCETAVIKHIGNSGRNALRADIVIYDTVGGS